MVSKAWGHEIDLAIEPKGVLVCWLSYQSGLTNTDVFVLSFFSSFFQAGDWLVARGVMELNTFSIFSSDCF